MRAQLRVRIAGEFSAPTLWGEGQCAENSRGADVVEAGEAQPSGATTG
jgi:hypothetical protein